MSMVQPWAFPRKLQWLYRYLGWYRAAKICALKPFDLLAKRFSDSQWFWRLVGSQFDAKHGVDTFEMVPVAKLEISDAQQEEAVFYEPSPIMEFGYVISLLPISYSDFTFVDMGSGKGRALLLAASFPFRGIVGVEISPKLHQIAESNIAQYRGPRKCNDITSDCDDAGACHLPDSPLVLFLFNPFSENVIKSMLQNLHKSLLKNPRRVIVVYGSPKQREVIDSTEWLTPIGSKLDDWYLIYESNLAV